MIQEIERQAMKLAQARSQLKAVVEDLEDQARALKKQFRRQIQAANNAVAKEQTALFHMVESNPSAFESPRTYVFHGIKVGYRKGVGAITWEDDARVVALIKRHLPDQAELLVRVTEEPVKAALKELAVGDLKRIGCQVTSAGDVVVVKPVDSEVDKIVNALLKEKLDDLEQEGE